MRQPLPQVQAELQIATGTRADAPERRVLRIQGAPAATTALAEWLSVLWLTPAMDRLFVESAGGRRRFLDRLVLALDPSHARHAQRYDAAMRARNRLLADLRSADPSWLAALEAQLADHGAAVDAARRETVALLDARLSCAEPGPFARAQIAIEGWEGDDVPLAEALRRGRARDAAAGRTLAGPHRSDLQVVHRDKQQAAALASTGEQKALLLGIVLAHAELVATRTGQPPVLLLDEVAAHLDPRRRGALFERLQDGGQTWMTGTEDALFAQIGAATRVRLG
jgi:DNA replication and repair protein RecF